MMEIRVNQSKFSFNYRSSYMVNKLKVSITEPDFDSKSAKIRNQFPASPVFFPSFIEIKIRRTTYQPKTTIWQDKNGKLQLLTEF